MKSEHYLINMIRTSYQNFVCSVNLAYSLSLIALMFINPVLSSGENPPATSIDTKSLLYKLVELFLANTDTVRERQIFKYI